MKYEINFGSSPVVFPELSEETLSEAGKNDLALLVYLVSVGGGEGEFDASEASEALGMEEAEAESAFAFLHGAGIIKTGRKKTGKAKKSKKSKVDVGERDEKNEEEDRRDRKDYIQSERDKRDTTVKTPLPRNNPPQYSGIEIDAVVSKNSLQSLIDECQAVMGKMFTPNDIGIIVSLYDYLGLSSEHILLLFAYCVSRGKHSVRYVEKTAYNLYDEGICTAEDFEAYILRMERSEDVESKFKSLIGREGALGKQESAGIERFCGIGGFDFEIIKKAYDITVENTGKYAWKYMEKVLQNWLDAGYTDISQIEDAMDSYSRNKKGKSGSFDTDDFFNDALDRSRKMMEKKKGGDKK